MKTLSECLADLLYGDTGYIELSGGLRLQYRAADAANNQSRLLCYRIEIDPGSRELVTVRQHLEKLLPQGATLPVLSDQFLYMGADGRARHCRVFSWRPAAASQQSWLKDEQNDPEM